MLKRNIILPVIMLILCILSVGGFAASDEDITDLPIKIEIEGKRLEKDKDYKLTYRDNINVGTGTVIIEFEGNYTGLKEQQFNIVDVKKRTSGGNGSSVRAANSETPSPIPETTQETDNKPVATTVPEIHKPYISGYNDGTFMPDNNITRAETAAMLSRIIYTDVPQQQAHYSDLQEGAWYISAVNSMSTCGVINGYTDGTFRPDNPITRAEFVTMLMQNREVMRLGKSPFNDVDADLWSANYIYSAYASEYIDGYEDGTFKPDSPITRAEAVKIINCALGRSDFMGRGNPFRDVSDVHWAYKHILEAAVEHQSDIQT